MTHMNRRSFNMLSAWNMYSGRFFNYNNYLKDKYINKMLRRLVVPPLELPNYLAPEVTEVIEANIASQIVAKTRARHLIQNR
jgi:hypothetical protein